MISTSKVRSAKCGSPSGRTTERTYNHGETAKQLHSVISGQYMCYTHLPGTYIRTYTGIWTHTYTHTHPVSHINTHVYTSKRTHTHTHKFITFTHSVTFPYARAHIDRLTHSPNHARSLTDSLTGASTYEHMLSIDSSKYLIRSQPRIARLLFIFAYLSLSPPSSLALSDHECC